MGIDRSKVMINIDRYGNTTAATIPLCLSEYWRDGRLKEGQNLVLASFVQAIPGGGAHPVVPEGLQGDWKSMRGLAYMFPGQGSQYVGMGKDIAHAFDPARRIFERADEVLGFRLSTVCFEGPEDELRQTRNTQPAIFLHSMALASVLRGAKATMAAGHSLGEYSALVYAGAISFEDGLRLVRLRGELMQQAGVELPGTMAAIVGLDPAVLEDVCKNAETDGVVRPANFNSPARS